MAVADHNSSPGDVTANDGIVLAFKRIGGNVGLVGTDVSALAGIDFRSVSEGEQRQNGGGNDEEANHDVVR
jgi:hypothetical protein